MKYFLCIVFILCFQVQQLQAQLSKRANVWYFGNGVGIDFNQNPPQEVFGHKQIDATEACGVICDTAGNILLYTDGKAVWNAKDKVIKNGGQIDISPTSAQGALFIPHPGNDSLIYLFQAWGYYLNYGYSLINLFADSGRSAVIKKNQTLIYTGPTDGEEKQIAINHANGRDVWVVTHKVNTNEYYAYLVTNKGLVTCPVVSKTGSVTSGFGAEQGYMSVTSDGRLLSNPFMITSEKNFNGMVDISQFNNQTGEISNTVTIGGFKLLPFSTCFSPNGKKLYMDELEGFLYQLDLEYLQKDSIRKRTDTLLKVRRRYNETMYLAPDNKIYISNNNINNEYRIGIINNPDGEAQNCGYSDTCDIYFGSTSNPGLNLPNHNRSYHYNPEIEIYYDFNKPRGTLTLHPYDTFSTSITRKIRIVNVFMHDSIEWNASGDTTLHFNDTGFFSIKYILGNGKIKIKNIDNRIIIRNEFLGKDTVLCPLTPLYYTLQAPKGMHCYQWSNGKTTDSIHITKPGKYTVLVTLPSMIQVWDTITIDTVPKPSPMLVVQATDTLFITGGLAPYTWYHNGKKIAKSVEPYLKIYENGTYTVAAIDSVFCYSFSDSVVVNNLDLTTPALKERPRIIIKNHQLIISPDGCCHYILLHDITGRKVFAGTIAEAKDFTLPNCEWFICTLITTEGSIHYKIHSN